MTAAANVGRGVAAAAWLGQTVERHNLALQAGVGDRQRMMQLGVVQQAGAQRPGATPGRGLGGSLEAAIPEALREIGGRQQQDGERMQRDGEQDKQRTLQRRPDLGGREIELF